MGTLIHLAKEHGWTPVEQARAAQSEPENENNKTATIARLAALSLIEYDRIRKAEAGKLECRPSTLDLLVNAKRLLMHPPSDSDNLQGVAVKLADVDPSPEPVNGDEVLDAVAKRFEHYVVLPEGAADMSALWCGHTHMYKRFPISPRLHISAPTEECGKTTVRNCASLFCARVVRTENMTTAVMFRLVSGHSPTILADECDKWLFINGELLGLVQSGHGKGGTIMRCEGDSNDLRQFGCYAPFALAAIGKLPSQLHSRSICIRLERATAEEIKQRSDFDFDHVKYETELNRKLARWILDNRERIASCNLKLPEHLFNRIADNWRPLFKIAQIAGGDWPQRCARALAKLTTGEDERENLRVMLLTDIREIFTGERIFSKDLVESLVELKERPWPEIQKGKPITARWLARNLSAFGVHSGNIRIGEEQAKGYERSQFNDVFARYIPENPEIPPRQPSQPSHTRGNTQNASVPKDEAGTDKKELVYEALGRLGRFPDGISGKRARYEHAQLSQTKGGCVIMQNTIGIFHQAADLGLKLAFEPPNTLTYEPIENCSPAFEETLRAHKPHLLALLRLPFVMVESQILDETIFFCGDEATKAALLKAGADEWSIYTKDELRILVSHNRAHPFLPDELCKLHTLKRTFHGRIIP